MTLVMVTVTPNGAQLVPGETVQLLATGWHDDNTSEDLTSTVTWTSSVPSAASVSVGGLVTALAVGAGVITATNVSPALTDTSVATVVAATSPDWVGSPSPFELRMAQPLPSYALESLRLRFFFAATTTHATAKSARATLQMALETELRVALLKVVDVAAGVTDSTVGERRRFIEVDRDMRMMGFLVGPALTELLDVRSVPTQYVDLIRRYLVADSPRYRMCAIAAILCLATAVLVA